MVARSAAALACCVLAVGLGACGGDDEDEPAATTAPAPAATQPAPTTQATEPGDAADDEKAEAREKRAKEKRRERERRKSEEPRKVTERPHAAREGGGDDADERPPKAQDKPGNSDSGYVPD